ncbi:MAG: magnesium transporter [Hespellia sp.]|nr:magnesium transporter [Hespellia sp.]
MTKMELSYAEKIVQLVRETDTLTNLKEKLEDYHEKDIACALELFEEDERKHVFYALSNEQLAEILPFAKDASDYIQEIGISRFANIISRMDADEAVDVLEDIDEETKKRIAEKLHFKAKKDIRLIKSFGEELIGSQMTTNFIQIKRGLTIKQATKSMIEQAKKNDNLNTIYVADEKNHFVGAIDLKDLIVARENDDLEDLIVTSYPFVYATEEIEECVDEIRDYAEDSIPVLNKEKEIVGVITATDIIEMVDDEMGEDYAKLAGMTEASDLNENVKDGMKKRMPWLVLLLFLGMIVSSVVGLFENVVSQIALIVCFQSLILDMAGNVGTQSLAVTIRVLMDENVSFKEKMEFTLKELRIGTCNGLVLGTMAFLFIGLYILLAKGKPVLYAFTISGCVGISLLVAMMISSLVGVLTPMFFHRIKVDPAVASGPLITTVNDLVAVVTYYGLSWILLINVFGIHN